MEIIQKISKYIVDTYELNTLTFLHTEEDLAYIIENAYSYVSIGGPSLITNQSAFERGYYKDMKPDLRKLQEQIRTEILSQMYTKNLITESEYKKACHTQ